MMSSRYKKVREKARRILQEVDKIELPDEPAEASSLEEDFPKGPSSKSLRKPAILFLILLGFAVLGYFTWMVYPSQLTLSILYGELEIASPEGVFFLNQSSSFKLPKEGDLAISIPQRTSIFQIPDILIIQGKKNSRFQIRLHPQKSLKIRIFKGSLVCLALSPLILQKGNSLWETQRGCMILDDSEQNPLRVILLSGTWKNGQVLYESPICLIKKGSKWKEKKKWSLPLWIVPHKDFPIPEISKVQVPKLTANPRPKQEKVKKILKPASPSAKAAVKIPPYPYDYPEWYKKKRTKINHLVLELEKKEWSLDALLNQLSLQLAFPISVDQDIPLSLIDSKITLPSTRGNLSKILSYMLMKKKWKLYILPSKIRLGPISFLPNLSGEEEVPFLFEKMDIIKKGLEKRIIFFDDILAQKTMDMVIQEKPLAYAIQKIQAHYGHSIQVPSKIGKKKISLSLIGASLDQILKTLLEPLGWTYAPMDLKGNLVIVPLKEGEALWKPYLAKKVFFTQSLPQIKRMVASFFAQEVSLPSKSWLPYELVQWIRKETAHKLYVSKRFWGRKDKIYLSGKKKVGEIMKALKKRGSFRVIYLDPKIYGDFFGTTSFFTVPPGFYLAD